MCTRLVLRALCLRGAPTHHPTRGAPTHADTHLADHVIVVDAPAPPAPAPAAPAAATAQQQAAALLSRKGLDPDDRLCQTAATHEFDLEPIHLRTLEFEEKENPQSASFAPVSAADASCIPPPS